MNFDMSLKSSLTPLTLLLLASAAAILQSGAPGVLAIDRAAAAASRDNGNNSSSSFALDAGERDNFTCVHGCICQLSDFTRSRYAVLCSGPGIRGIPAFLTEDLHQIESMTLARTSIGQIDSLRLFSSLTYLNLNRSLVQTVDSTLVTTFPALESLHLADSRLRQVSGFNVLQHMSLREVDFSYNQLASFDSSGSMSLRVLLMRRNLLDSLRDLGPSYAALRRLDVAENRLTLEGLASWDPPPELEVLDLSGNQLRGAKANASFLLRLPELQQLSLAGNQLESLGPVTDWLPAGSKLWKLSLAGNPLACSCALYRDKERLALRGVIVADAPACRLANGSECPLTRLGSWACADVDGGGGGGATAGPEQPAVAAFQLPLVIALAVLAAAGLAACAVGLGVWACRRRSPPARPPPDAAEEAEYPYNTASVKSTNLTCSQASLATAAGRSLGVLPYAFDPQRSRVFSRKLTPAEQQQQQQAGWQRSQSEQILGGGGGCGGRGSTPLPPIPDAGGAPPRPEDYVDMGAGGGSGGGSGGGAYQQMPGAYEDVQLQYYQQQSQPQLPQRQQYQQQQQQQQQWQQQQQQRQQQQQQQRQPPPSAIVQEGYVDMTA